MLEGAVVDLATQQPLVALVSAVTPSSSKGKDDFTPVAQTITDGQGHWVLKNVPAGCRRLTIAAEGYMPRSLYAPNTDGQPGWHFFERGLSRPGVVTGRVLDKTSDQPLVNVEIRLKGDASGPAADYWRMNRYVTMTDADGYYRFEQVPNGTGTLRVRHGSYCLPSSILKLTTPARDVDLRLVKSAKLHVTVDFTGTDRPETYLVMVRSADGGAALPSQEQLQNTVTLVHNAHYATDGLRVEIRPIDNNKQVSFTVVPPGKYILEGWPSRFGPGGRSTPFKGIGRSKPFGHQCEERPADRNHAAGQRRGKQRRSVVSHHAGRGSGDHQYQARSNPRDRSLRRKASSEKLHCGVRA